MRVLSPLRNGHRYSENKSESRHIGTGMGSSQSRGQTTESGKLSRADMAYLPQAA